MSTTAIPTLPVSGESVPLLTAAEFCLRYENLRAELVKGVVQELPMPFPKHGTICNRIAYHITHHVLQCDCGHVAGNDSFVKTHSNPDSVRGGDLCYWSYDRQPRGPLPEGLLASTPNLIVEVRSPTQTWMTLFAKVLEYLEAGVGVVVLVDPKTETVSVYRPDELQQIFHNGDELVLPDVLPGFALRILKLFE